MINKLLHYRRLSKIRRYTPKFWLLPQDNLGYIQIPKVASSSIHIALVSHVTGTDASTFEKHQLKEFSNAHSTHLRQEIIRNNHPDTFIFSFVRDPYARIYSCYKNKVSKPNLKKNIFACHNINLDDTFDTFVEKICDIPDIESDRHFRSQSWFLMNGTNLIPDFVGKLENMDTDWATLSDRFNLPTIPHVNTTAKTSYVMSARNKSLIQQRYSDDFKNFYDNQF